VIKSFADRRTAAIFERRPVRGVARELGEQVRRKLRQIDGAERLVDLRSPPGNRLEALRGDRTGRASASA
jgi:toxin HigB-1